VCECEREGTRVMPNLYTSREEKGKRERVGGGSALAIDGQRGARV
jgi:hypothetical protein